MNAVTAELLIQTYYKNVDIVAFSNFSDANAEALVFVLKNDLAHDESGSLELTDRGMFLVNDWLSTPLPYETKVFKINRDKVENLASTYDKLCAARREGLK